MTDDRELSLILDRWLADGPAEMPDRVVDVVALGISRQRQRPAWRLDWRRYTMNTNLKIAAALVAVLAIIFAGYNLLPAGSTGVGGPAPTSSPTAGPTPTATPAPTSSASPLTGGTLAGTYWTAPFGGTADALTLTFTVPAGWVGFPDWALLGPKGAEEPAGIGVGFLMASALYADPCHWDVAGTRTFPQPGDVSVGPTVDDLVSALRANPAYDATAPVDVAVDGHAGKQLVLQLPSDVDFDACDSPTGATTGAYFVWSPMPGNENDLYAQGPGNRWDLRIVDVDGTRIIILINDFSGTSAEDRAAAQAIVDSIRITP